MFSRKKRNPVDFSFPSKVGPAKPCAQVGSAQDMPLKFQDGVCRDIHPHVRLYRGLQLEGSAKPSNPCSPCALQTSLHMTKTSQTLAIIF